MSRVYSIDGMKAIAGFLERLYQQFYIYYGKLLLT